MSVQISELEVVPQAEREQQLRQNGQAGQQPGAPHAQSPELEHEIVRTVALLNARELRLRAD